ncbi:MAG: hypothetical protein ACR2M1_12590 [Gemmatimonadaceae bacterium]
MDKANPDNLEAPLPRRREVVVALIKDCEDMMRMQKIASISAAGVKRAWPDHQQRIRDMLNLRHDMMKSMKI